MHVGLIDLKSGQNLKDFIDGEWHPRIREVNHDALDHWLKANNVEFKAWQGVYYRGVDNYDRIRLEGEGKVFVFANGGKPYFFDPETARLLVYGDKKQGIEPFYAADENSAHNTIAYGSLFLSDGRSSAVIGKSFDKQTVQIADQTAKILVVDDDKRTYGSEVLRYRNGKPVPSEEIERLYDRLGDGTMLVTTPALRGLLTEDEIAQVIKKVLLQKDSRFSSIDSAFLRKESEQIDASALTELVPHFHTRQSPPPQWVSEEIAEKIHQQLDHKVERLVTQFRVKTPLPGEAKGTMATSRWCQDLGVDCIIGTNCIKGADSRFETPGIKEVEYLWLNRMLDARYGLQEMGPQVKGCIPETTRLYFNPYLEGKLKELNEVTGSYEKGVAWYVARVEEEIKRKPDFQPASFYYIAKADKLGLLAGNQPGCRIIEDSLRKERLSLALSGIFLPSAIAQKHSALKPWEMCNPKMEHGAICVWYRSPYSNIMASMVTINNLDALRRADLEAFRKDGTVNLHPVTAKEGNVDFDGDRLGISIGCLPAVPDLPERIRIVLAQSGVESLSEQEQYKAALILFNQLSNGLETPKKGQLLKVGEEDKYSQLRETLGKQLSPTECPPKSIKRKKVKHPWDQRNESHSEAAWNAWEKVAEDPIGRVANLSTSLRALSNEIRYASGHEQLKILSQVVKVWNNLLERDESESIIPTNDFLKEQKYPEMQFKDRIQAVVTEGRDALKSKDLQTASQILSSVERILFDSVEVINAKQLQIAVDVLKSAEGIEESLYNFLVDLRYRKDSIQKMKDDSSVYMGGKTLQTSLSEPISWGVNTSNQLYSESRIPTRQNLCFYALFDGKPSVEQKALVEDFVGRYLSLRALIQEASASSDTHNELSVKPIFKVTVPQTGNSIKVIASQDIDNQLWRNPQECINKVSLKNIDGKVHAFYGENQDSLGVVPESDVTKHGLIEKILKRGGSLLIEQPIVELLPPSFLQNDLDYLLVKANNYVSDFVETIPTDERHAYLKAFLETGHGFNIVMNHFSEEVCEALSHPKKLQIVKPEFHQLLPENSQLIVRFVQPEDGKQMQVHLLSKNEEQLIATAIVDRESPTLPAGAEIDVTPLLWPDDKRFTLKIHGKDVLFNIADSHEAGQNVLLRQYQVEAYLGYKDQVPYVYVGEGTQKELLGTLDLKNELRLKELGLLQSDRWVAVTVSPHNLFFQMGSNEVVTNVQPPMLHVDTPNTELKAVEQEYEIA